MAASEILTGIQPDLATQARLVVFEQWPVERPAEDETLLSKREPDLARQLATASAAARLAGHAHTARLLIHKYGLDADFPGARELAAHWPSEKPEQTGFERITGMVEQTREAVPVGRGGQLQTDTPEFHRFKAASAVWEFLLVRRKHMRDSGWLHARDAFGPDEWPEVRADVLGILQSSPDN